MIFLLQFSQEKRMTKKKLIIIKVLKCLGSELPAGKIVRVEAKGKLPKDRFWRNRVQDAKIDQCVEVLDSLEQPKKQKSKTQKPNKTEKA